MTVLAAYVLHMTVSRVPGGKWFISNLLITLTVHATYEAISRMTTRLTSTQSFSWFVQNFFVFCLFTFNLYIFRCNQIYIKILKFNSGSLCLKSKTSFSVNMAGCEVHLKYDKNIYLLQCRSKNNYNRFRVGYRLR